MRFQNIALLSNDQAIHHMISSQTICQIKLELRLHLTVRELWELKHQLSIAGSTLSQINASPRRVIGLCHNLNLSPIDTTSARTRSVRVEWLRQSGRATSQLSETSGWQNTLRPAPIAHVVIDIALQSQFRCMF